MRSSLRILVTGASGFLGSHLVGALRRNGHDVWAMVRQTSNVQRLELDKSRIIYADLADEKCDFADAVSGRDIVFHTAALMAHLDWLPRKKFVEVNKKGTMRLAQAASKANVKHFIYISSVGVLGETGPEPADEERPYGMRLSNYEYSKAEAEKAIIEFYRDKKFPVTIVRPAQLYGPRMIYAWGEVIQSIDNGTMRVIGKGEGKIQLTYIEDAVEPLLNIMGRDDTFGEIFHIAAAEAHSMREIFDCIAHCLNKPSPKRVPYGLMYIIAGLLEPIPWWLKTKKLRLLTRHRVRLFNGNRLYAIEKAKERIGFIPKTGLQEGMEKTIAWFEKEGYLSKR